MFYVLRGELTMELEGESQTIGAGEALEIVPGRVHQAVNASKAEVYFLVISAPSTVGDREPA